MWEWIIWGLLLMAQNASFTLVSRARNTSSLGYHAVAALLSNGVFFASYTILLGNMLEVLKTGSWREGVMVGVYYVACTMIGSLAMHWFALRKLEKRTNVKSTF